MSEVRARRSGSNGYPNGIFRYLFRNFRYLFRIFRYLFGNFRYLFRNFRYLFRNFRYPVGEIGLLVARNGGGCPPGT